MTVFNDIARPDDRTKQVGESQFAYLNRCGHAIVGRLRGFVDDLSDEYLLMHGRVAFRNVITRFRSADDGQHHGAYFELVINRLLGRADCQVKAVEPALANGSKSKPDFLVEGRNGAEFYVETRVVTRESELGWLGVGDGLPKVVDPESPIRAGIKKKLPHYGDPGLPLILAVNTLDMATGRLAFEDVLLGSYGVQDAMLSDGLTVQRVVRGNKEGLNDGILADDLAIDPVDNPVNNVSAFLFMCCCNLGNEPNVWYCLYHNPRARRPLQLSLPLLYRAIPMRIHASPNRYWQYRDGKSLDELLGLPPNWPRNVPSISDSTMWRLQLMWSGAYR